MNLPSPATDGFPPVSRKVFVSAVGVGVAWTAVVVAVLVFGVFQERRSVGMLAYADAVASYDRDTAYRRFMTACGGIYAPVGGPIQPNPRLAHVSERDVRTPSGRELTLVNPSYAERLVKEMEETGGGTHVRLTSLWPIHGGAAPDEWERAALASLVRGAAEVAGVAEVGGRGHFRLMRPLIVDGACLGCHGEHAYEIGEVRGGVSVAVPLAPYRKVCRQGTVGLAGGLAALWLVGVAVIAGGARVMGKRVREREVALRALEGANEDLKCREAELGSIFRAAPTGIGVVSNRVFTSVNDRFCEIVGYSSDELEGQDARVVYPTDDEHEWVGREKYRQISAHGTGTVETRMLRKDGRIIDVLLSSTPLDIEDMAAGVTFTALDITARKKAEDELERSRALLENRVVERTAELEAKAHELQRSQTALQYLLEDVNEAKAELEAANEKLRDLDRLKSMFIASMNHELRTPLNSVIGFTSVLLKGWAGEISEEQRDQLERVNRAGKHLLDLVSDVIDISKIEGGVVVPFVEETDLAEVLTEVCVAVLHEVETKGLELELDLPGSPIMLRTDRRRLLQCLLNLVGNAVKFTAEGGVIVKARADGGRIRISVRDTGIGIPEEDLPLLFKPFVRLESPLRAITQGTGLGLYLTRKLATEILGGDVRVESERGEGSLFTLEIPTDGGLQHQQAESPSSGPGGDDEDRSRD